jgi:hypothetical protein
MKIVHAPLLQTRRAALFCSAVLLLLSLALSARAQSTNIEFPTPVRANEISGMIAPRDVGDPRLTRYFYSLTGTNGDLIVTIESRNLNGDVDLFTAGTLRPLAKLSMYAGDTAATTSKSIYFKRQEALILRVEARTPNDLEGSFRIRFDGAFAPILGEVREPEPLDSSTPQTDATGRRTKRVTATGARIDEPVAEIAGKPTETEPARIGPPEATATERQPETTQPKATNVEPTTRPAPRASRPRRPRRLRTAPRTARTRPSPTTVENQPTEQPNATTPATPEPAMSSGPRLIIETKDGLRVERYMTSVRRVTVDNGQIIVFLKNGKTERQPMTNVLKMSIEP